MKSALIFALALATGPLAHTQDTPPTPDNPPAALATPQAEPAPRPAKSQDPTRALTPPRAENAPAAPRTILTPPLAPAGTPPATPAVQAVPGVPGSALGDGLLLEETSTDLASAVRRYEQAVRQYDQQREAAGIALLRLAEIQRKQKNTDAAIELYHRVASEFNDRPHLAEAAQQQLNALVAPQATGGIGMMTPSQAWTQYGKVTNLDEQRALLKEEISLVQDQIAATKKAIEAGSAQYNAAWENERELLKLKRELAALDGRVKPDLVEMTTSAGGGTAASIPGAGNTAAMGGGAYGETGTLSAGMGGSGVGTTGSAASLPLKERLAANSSGKVPVLGDIPIVGRLFQNDPRLNRLMSEIDLLETELQRLRWDTTEIDSEVETVQSIPVQNLPEETVRSASFSRLKEQYAQTITGPGSEEQKGALSNKVIQKMEEWKSTIYLPEKEGQLRALQIKMKNREQQLRVAKAQLDDIHVELKKAENEAAAKSANSAKPTPMSPELMKRYGLSPEAEKKF